MSRKPALDPSLLVDRRQRRFDHQVGNAVRRRLKRAGLLLPSIIVKTVVAFAHDLLAEQSIRSVTRLLAERLHWRASQVNDDQRRARRAMRLYDYLSKDRYAVFSNAELAAIHRLRRQAKLAKDRDATSALEKAIKSCRR